MSTYTPIASVTLSSTQSSVTFSGIPQTYTDLVLVINSGETVSGDIGYIQFNGDTASNYSSTVLYGDGTSAGSSRLSNSSYIAVLGRFVGMNSSLTDNGIVNIMNYANTTTYKTTISRSNVPSYGTSGDVGLWRNTAAITSILVGVSAGRNWLSGSTFNLYGIANASITNVAKATGGDSVYTDGTYWYHTFRSSGTFTPTQALTADYLVVAGGGGGGYAPSGGGSGGGGAGGLRSTVTATGGGGSLETPLTMSINTAYTVVVGAGGSAGSSIYPTDGANSSISGAGITTITSIGGGSSAGTGGNAISGGSGGGGGYQFLGAVGTANQGYAGGSGSSSGTPFGAGGGGGAGGVGVSPGASSSGGAGGTGVAVSITGSSVTYAGGGGGGCRSGGSTSSGGAGGGGSGSAGGTGGNGTDGLGGGGGGASDALSGGNGGSGIVVIRYAV